MHMNLFRTTGTVLSLTAGVSFVALLSLTVKTALAQQAQPQQAQPQQAQPQQAQPQQTQPTEAVPTIQQAVPLPPLVVQPVKPAPAPRVSTRAAAEGTPAASAVKAKAPPAAKSLPATAPAVTPPPSVPAPVVTATDGNRTPLNSDAVAQSASTLGLPVRQIPATVEVVDKETINLSPAVDLRGLAFSRLRFNLWA